MPTYRNILTGQVMVVSPDQIPDYEASAGWVRIADTPPPKKKKAKK